MAKGKQKNTVLFVSREPETRYYLRELLQRHGYEVVCRQTCVSALQLLSVEEVDLLVIDMELQEGAGVELTRKALLNPKLAGTGIVMVGKDDNKGTNTIAAFDAGADDFVQSPFIPDVCVARIARLLRKTGKAAGVSSMSVQVKTEELPSVLQFMETEQKTGRVEIKSGTAIAELWLHKGHLVNASAPYVEGLDAVAEILCWPSVNVSFHEVTVSDDNVKFEQKLSGVIMNCAVAVDEYREMQSRLPGPEAMFLPGPTPLPETAPPEQKLLSELAVSGFDVDDLVRGQEMGQVRATRWVAELLETGVLAFLETPLADYVEGCQAQYRNSYLPKRLSGLASLLQGLELPFAKPTGTLPYAAAEWLSPAPKIILAGDHAEHIALFTDTLKQIIGALYNVQPAEQKQLGGVMTMRLDFGEKRVLDVQRLPAVFERYSLRALDEYVQEACAVLFFCSNQDHQTNKNNLRLLRQLRQRFRGVYGFGVPRPLEGVSQKHIYKVSCEHCGYRLAVNAAEAGLHGQCPVCSREIVIPEPVAHLSTCMFLPEEVMVALVDPLDQVQCRDLVAGVLQSVIGACEQAAAGPEESAPAPAPEAAPELPAAPAPQRVKLTAKAKPRPQQAVGPTAHGPSGPSQNVRSMPPPELSDTHTLVVGADEVQVSGRAAPPPADDLGLPEDGEPDEKTLCLDDLLKSDDDDFDIDDFINRVRG